MSQYIIDVGASHNAPRGIELKKQTFDQEENLTFKNKSNL